MSKKYDDEFVDDLLERIEDLENRIGDLESFGIDRIQEQNNELELENEKLRNKLDLIEKLIEE